MFSSTACTEYRPNLELFDVVPNLFKNIRTISKKDFFYCHNYRSIWYFHLQETSLLFSFSLLTLKNQQFFKIHQMLNKSDFKFRGHWSEGLIFINVCSSHLLLKYFYRIVYIWKVTVNANFYWVKSSGQKILLQYTVCNHSAVWKTWNVLFKLVTAKHLLSKIGERCDNLRATGRWAKIE